MNIKRHERDNLHAIIIIYQNHEETIYPSHAFDLERQR